MASIDDNADPPTLKFRSLESQICALKKDLGNKITFEELQVRGIDMSRTAASSGGSGGMSSGDAPMKTVDTCEYGKNKSEAVSVKHPLNGDMIVKPRPAAIADGNATPEYPVSSNSENSQEGGSSTKVDASPSRNWDSDIEMKFSGQEEDDEPDTMPFEDIRSMILDITTLSVEERQEITRLVELYEPPNITAVSSQNEIRFWYLSNLTLREIEKYVASKMHN